MGVFRAMASCGTAERGPRRGDLRWCDEKVTRHKRVAYRYAIFLIIYIYAINFYNHIFEPIVSSNRAGAFRFYFSIFEKQNRKAPDINTTAFSF